MSNKSGSKVNKELVEELSRAGLSGFLTALRAFRFKSYVERPARMLHDGWRLDQECQIARGLPRSYRLGDRLRGQHLTVDREAGVARLTTYYQALSQTIEYDLKRDRVLFNWTGRRPTDALGEAQPPTPAA